MLREELGNLSGLEERIVGKSPSMEALRNTITALSGTDADVLILGETGSGKEVVARALHEEGLRKDGPFVALNCGALPADIIESELFGHEKVHSPGRVVSGSVSLSMLMAGRCFWMRLSPCRSTCR